MHRATTIGRLIIFDHPNLERDRFAGMLAPDRKPPKCVAALIGLTVFLHEEYRLPQSFVDWVNTDVGRIHYASVPTPIMDWGRAALQTLAQAERRLQGEAIRLTPPCPPDRYPQCGTTFVWADNTAFAAIIGRRSMRAREWQVICSWETGYWPTIREEGWRWLTQHSSHAGLDRILRDEFGDCATDKDHQRIAEMLHQLTGGRDESLDEGRR